MRIPQTEQQPEQQPADQPESLHSTVSEEAAPEQSNPERPPGTSEKTALAHPDLAWEGNFFSTDPQYRQNGETKQHPANQNNHRKEIVAARVGDSLRDLEVLPEDFPIRG